MLFITLDLIKPIQNLSKTNKMVLLYLNSVHGFIALDTIYNNLKLNLDYNEIY